MSDIDFLDLYAKFAGFRVMVLANRLGCTNDLALRAHDRLARELAKLNEDMRKGLAAERDLLLNTDPARCDDLGEMLWCCERNFDELRCDPEGIDLLENRIHVDWGTREWYDPRTKAWVSFFDARPPVLDAAGEKLCGLDKIIMQIREETGIRFTTFMSGTSDDGPDRDDIDPECYEDLHGFDREVRSQQSMSSLMETAGTSKPEAQARAAVAASRLCLDMKAPPAGSTGRHGC